MSYKGLFNEKTITILLCLLAVLSLVSCTLNDKDKNDIVNENTKEKQDNTDTYKETPNSDSMNPNNQQYYKIEKIELSKVRYYIYDSCGNIVLSEETDRPLDISMSGENIVDIRIGMGTGISIHKYYDVVNNRFSGEYSYVVATSGNLVAYIDGDSLYNRSLVVRDIFDRNIFYKEFELDFSPTVTTPIEKAEFTEGENELEITYLSERSPVSFSEVLPIRYNFDDYNSVIKLYGKVIDECAMYTDAAYDTLPKQLGLVDENEKVLLRNLFTSAYLFYPGRGQEDSQALHYKLKCGYATKDLNGDGVDELVLLNDDYTVVAIFSMADGKPVLLDIYIPRGSCWIDGDGLLHVDGSGGAMCNNTAIYQISDGGKQLDLLIEFGMCDQWKDSVYEITYYKTINGQKQIITEEELNILYGTHGKYLGYAGGAATKEYSGLIFTPLFDEADIADKADIAMDMYVSVLKNEIKVYETDIDEYNYIKDCKTSYMRITLSQADSLSYAFVDMDGDGSKELLLDCGDILILRYYEGVVYVYPFTFRSMYGLQTDGSYSWNHTGSDFEYGESKLAFEGKELKIKELWRIVNDGEPDAEYYIDGKQVTQKELTKYLEDNSKTKVEFSPLDVPWQNEISISQAMEIASNYWLDWSKEAWSEENGYIICYGENSRAPSSTYVILLRHLVMDNHYSTVDEIWVDSTTGETIIPY